MSTQEKSYVICSVQDKLSAVPQNFVEEIEKHFQICWFKDFEASPKIYADKVVAVISVHGSQVAEKLLKQLPVVKIVANVGAGYNHIDVSMVRNMGIKVSNTPGVLNDAVAEMGITLLLAIARNLVQNAEIATSPYTKAFPKNFLCSGLTNNILGIVGMGGIGFAVAERARAFQMKILYHNRNKRSDDHLVAAKYCASLDEMLPLCDYVVLSVQLTQETKKMFGERQFKLMKNSASFVNISRGGTVNHDALIIALQSGELNFAALDVTDPEPLPRDHQLLKLKNVIVTPHCSSATVGARLAMIQKALENIIAAQEGKSLPSEVFQ